MKSVRFNVLSLAVLAMTAAPSPSFAKEGGHSGNGGNAVVCFANPEIAKELNQTGVIVSKPIPDEFLDQIISIEALELDEAAQGQHGESAKTRLDSKYAAHFLTAVKGRLAKDLPELNHAIEAGKAMIGTRISHVSGSVLIPAADIAPLVYPRKGCVYTTVIRQTDIGNGSLRKIAIDDRLFLHPKHSRFSRETLMLHEYILAYMTFNFRNETSENTRAIVARAVAQDLSIPELAELLTAVGYKLEHTNPAIRADVESCEKMKKKAFDSRQTFLSSKDRSFENYSAILAMLKKYDATKSAKQMIDLITSAGKTEAATGTMTTTADQKLLPVFVEGTIQNAAMNAEDTKRLITSARILRNSIEKIERSKSAFIQNSDQMITQGCAYDGLLEKWLGEMKLPNASEFGRNSELE